MPHSVVGETPPEAIRTLFLSDTHLGCRYSQAEALLAFLRSVNPQQVYIVGDFFDGWRLRKNWYWTDTYSQILHHLLGWMDRGVRIRYAPGNHDEFLREFVRSLGRVELADEFIHTTADQRKLLVLHGDQFDAVVRHIRWLSLIGDMGYNLLLRVNGVYNAIRRRLGCGYWSLSAYVKSRVKQATSFITRFEDAVTHYARNKNCDGVVCGHIHTPVIRDCGGITYYNTGDWVETCSALLEDFDGQLRLVHWTKRLLKSAPSPEFKSARLSEFSFPREAAPLETVDSDVAEEFVPESWRDHGEDLLQHVGGGPGPRHARADHGRSPADRA